MKFSILIGLLGLIFFASTTQAQIITINPANTHQTWQFYGGDTPTHDFDDTNCTLISNSSYAQALSYLIDAGMNEQRIEIVQHFHIEGSGGTDTNDNNNPFNTNAAGFTYTVNFNRSGICPTNLTKTFFNAQTTRTNLIDYGVTPLSSTTFIIFSNSNMPSFWWSPTIAQSTGVGIDESSEAQQATIDYMWSNYGFCTNWMKVNEPDSNSLFLAGANAGAASWLPGVTNSFTSRITSDTHCPSVKFMGPEDASPDHIGGGLLSDLSTFYGSVPNSESHLNYITYHGYSFPADKGAAIYAHANAEGKQVAMTEYNLNGCCSNQLTYGIAFTQFTSNFLPLINTGNISGWEWNAVWAVCYSNPTCALTTTQDGGGMGIGWDSASSLNGNSPNFFLQPWYYLWRQFTKYVQPGYVRIDDSSNDPNFFTSAFVRPDGTEVIVIANGYLTSHGVTLNGLHNNSYTVHKLDQSLCVTTGQFRCTPDDSTTATPSGGSLSLTMPANGVWTLTETQAADPLASIYEPPLDCNNADYPNSSTIKLDVDQTKLRSDESYSDLTTGKPCVDLFGFPNETIDFQAHIKGPVTSLGITLSDLHKTNGPGGTYTIHTSSTSAGIAYRELYICMASACGSTHPLSCSTVSGQTCQNFYGHDAVNAGSYPDALEPATDPYYSQPTNAFPFTVPSNTNQSIWIDDHIDAAAPAGWYSGDITITSSGTPIAIYPIRLAVGKWPHAQNDQMPSTASIKTTVSYTQTDGQCLIWGITSACTGYPNGYGGAQADGISMFLDHRWSVSTSDVSADFPDAGSFTQFDADYGPSLSGTASYVSTLLSGAKLTLWNIACTGDCAIKGAAGSFQTATFQNFATHFSAKSWGQLFWYMCDEPMPEGGGGCGGGGNTATQNIISNGNSSHSATTAIPTLVTTTIAQATAQNYLNQVDILAPNLLDLYGGGINQPVGAPPVGTSTRSNYNTWLTGTGCVGCPTRQIGSYNDDEQGAVHFWDYQANYAIDGLPIAHRAMMWSNYFYNMNLELYNGIDAAWCNGCNAFGDDLFHGSMWGDTTLAYPCSTTKCGTATNPIYLPSMRLKIMRDGEQDYEYMNVLVQNNQTGYVSTQVASWFTDGNHFSTNMNNLLTAKDSMFTKIHQITFPINPLGVPIGLLP